MVYDTAKWKRWQSGRVILHLANGHALAFDGRIRLKETREHVVDYEAQNDNVAMLPALSDIIAIEVF